MELRKIAETSATITLGWDPVEGADGYLFYADGKRVSRTFDPKRRTVKFSKGPSSFAVEAVRFQRVDSDSWPDVTPPPPPPTYKKVAPRVAYKTDRGDARYCMFNPDGSLRPGISRSSDGRYHDEVATYSADGDGLEESAVRSPGSPADCATGSDSIDGRPYCSLPMQGDPTKNTGSWLI